MAFIGTPLDTRNTFQSLQGKRFNGDGSTTAFTLDVAPSSTLDIEVFVGNVRQDPNSAYTLSGTTLTFTGAPPSGTNNIYVVHQAKSVGTINAPANSITSDQLNTALLTGATDIGAGIADADLFLVDDGAGGTLRKTAASRIKTYIGDNTPNFHAYKSSAQSIAFQNNVKITFETESFDSDNAFSSSKFTVPSGKDGKYFLYASIQTDSSEDFDDYQIKIYKNGNLASGTRDRHFLSETIKTFTVLSLSASDYIEVYAYVGSGSNKNIVAESTAVYFGGFKIIE